MPTIKRFCSKCGCQTDQTVEDLVVPMAQPVPINGSVDLTGGFYKGPGAGNAPPEGRVMNTMPYTKIYKCMRCGSNVTAIGDDNNGVGGQDDFSLLARGVDWKDPGQ